MNMKRFVAFVSSLLKRTNMNYLSGRKVIKSLKLPPIEDVWKKSKKINAFESL